MENTKGEFPSRGQEVLSYQQEILACLAVTSNANDRSDLPASTTFLPPIKLYRAMATSHYFLSPNGDRPECCRCYEALGLGSAATSTQNKKRTHRLHPRVADRTATNAHSLWRSKKTKKMKLQLNTSWTRSRYTVSNIIHSQPWSEIDYSKEDKL